MTHIQDIFLLLSDSNPVLVDLPGKREEIVRSRALLQHKDFPCFELLFPPDSWMADDLNFGADCVISVEHSGTTTNLIARLDHLSGDRLLRFTARESVSPITLRDYFRVSINTTITASHTAGEQEIHGQSWDLTGTTIDLSGSGVLALFPEKPPSNTRIQLTIDVPNEEVPIVCQATIVRSYRMRKNRYQVAFHFDDVAPKTRDAIIACCMQEQRRQLRENVHAG